MLWPILKTRDFNSANMEVKWEYGIGIWKKAVFTSVVLQGQERCRFYKIVLMSDVTCSSEER